MMLLRIKTCWKRRFDGEEMQKWTTGRHSAAWNADIVIQRPPAGHRVGSLMLELGAIWLNFTCEAEPIRRGPVGRNPLRALPGYKRQQRKANA